jgi:hypothetical protein
MHRKRGLIIYRLFLFYDDGKINKGDGLYAEEMFFSIIALCYPRYFPKTVYEN